MQQSNSVSHLRHLDSLRGFAALTVCIFHFSHGGILFPATMARTVASHGYLGVQIFFVLSGCVIPWAIWKRPFGWRDVPSFLGKRFLRLQPPYFAAMILALLLLEISKALPGYRGNQMQVPWFSYFKFVLSDSLYVTGVLDQDWILVVAWTLAIEVQFYLLASVLLCFLKKNDVWSNTIVACLLSVAPLIFEAKGCFLTGFLPLFMLGWTSAVLLSNPGSIAPWLSVVCCFFALGCSHSIEIPLVSLFAFTFIQFGKSFRFVPLEWIGKISYSIYLLHVPIGGRLINLSRRFPDEPISQYIVSLAAFFLTVVVATMFWRYVEMPAQRLSKSVFGKKSLSIADRLDGSKTLLSPKVSHLESDVSLNESPP